MSSEGRRSRTDRGAYRIVARREFVERARDRGFRISTGITVSILVIFILSQSFLHRGTRFTVAAVGPRAQAVARLVRAAAPSVGFAISSRSYASPERATTAVRQGVVDAAVLPDAIVVRSQGRSDQLLQALQLASQREGMRAALAEEGLSAEQIDRALGAPPLAVRALEPIDTRRGQAAAVAFVGVLALYGQLFAYGYWVAAGVVEEKSSRVVEVLLSTIRPKHLLRGKILGIGALGLCQLLLIAAVGLATALSTGLLRFPAGAAAAAGYVLAWFLLGFGFYATLFAVAGAIVSRQEDLQATMTPLSIVIIASFFVGITAVEHPTSTLATVASLLPPSAPLTMPTRLVLGQASWETALLSAAISVSVTLALIPVATRAYARAVLRTGRVRLREAFGRGAA